MSPPKLKLYVDVVSPFGYIAYWVLRVRLSYPFLPEQFLLAIGISTMNLSVEKTNLTDHCQQHDPVFAKCEITYVPMFLGGVMKACNNTPPINIKSE